MSLQIVALDDGPARRRAQALQVFPLLQRIGDRVCQRLGIEKVAQQAIDAVLDHFLHRGRAAVSVAPA